MLTLATRLSLLVALHCRALAFAAATILLHSTSPSGPRLPYFSSARPRYVSIDSVRWVSDAATSTLPTRPAAVDVGATISCTASAGRSIRLMSACPASSACTGVGKATSPRVEPENRIKPRSLHSCNRPVNSTSSARMGRRASAALVSRSARNLRCRRTSRRLTVSDDSPMSKGLSAQTCITFRFCLVSTTAIVPYRYWKSCKLPPIRSMLITRSCSPGGLSSMVPSRSTRREGARAALSRRRGTPPVRRYTSSRLTETPLISTLRSIARLGIERPTSPSARRTTLRSCVNSLIAGATELNPGP
mmetsp:Transcript_28295/g.91589  ORF Transcript_28295/g.91589 Transcript_28295/m.91589 type:complete len:304 (-) Transcript_28295:1262-2173(-)